MSRLGTLPPAIMVKSLTAYVPIPALQLTDCMTKTHLLTVPNCIDFEIEMIIVFTTQIFKMRIK